MSGNPEQKGTNFGFDEGLDSAAADFQDWTPDEATNDRQPADRSAVRKAAEEVGYTDREPKSTAPPQAAGQKEEGSLTVRAKTTVINDFKAFAKEQTPKWPHSFVLERAMAALRREMAEQGG